CSRGGLLCLPDQLHFVNTVLTARLPEGELRHVRNESQSGREGCPRSLGSDSASAGREYIEKSPSALPGLWR
ncbi:hypothetical protein VC566_25770, partial [Citrobacter freundii]|nr:hypothetical protein [Citrobacter freundii]